MAVSSNSSLYKLEAQLSKGRPFCLVTAGLSRPITIAFVGELLKLDLLDKLIELLPSTTTNCNRVSRESLFPCADGSMEGGREGFVFAMVPFCQIREHGFEAKSNGETILAIKVEHQWRLNTTDLIQLIEDKYIETIETENEPQFDPVDEEYEEIVKLIYEKEICNGEGSSFVVPRLCSAQLTKFNPNIPLSIYRRLLLQEKGSYWTFIFHDGEDRWFIGASPEKHLLIENGNVLMHPISGTFRKPLGGIEGKHETVRKEFLDFLKDEKEINELFMVTDEELKMMCQICPDGGEVIGPRLREMSHLIHTEYSLFGKWTEHSCCMTRNINSKTESKDQMSLKNETKRMIEAFRKSMYAPTVTGSPMENSCRRLSTYEKCSRSYYSSAAVLLGRDITTGRAVFDSCITIRTMEVFRSGLLQMRVGATLVRNSVPSEEAKETVWKLKGLLRSIKSVDQSPSKEILSKDMESFLQNLFPCASLRGMLEKTLHSRNFRVSTFWKNLQQHHDEEPVLRFPSSSGPHELKGKRALLVDNEDHFIYMFRYMITHLGIHSDCRTFTELFNHYKTEESLLPFLQSYDLIVVGPGPGDPREDTTKMTFSQNIIHSVLKNRNNCMSTDNKATPKLMCICLGHQLLGRALNLSLKKKPIPFQGVQVEGTVFGSREKLGFYNSFYVGGESSKILMSSQCNKNSNNNDWEVDLSDDQEEALMLRNRRMGVVSSQFHPESILTANGLNILLRCFKFIL